VSDLRFTREATARVAGDLFQRLDDLIQVEMGRLGEGTSVHHLRWMMQEVMGNASVWPIDKLNRWIGFAQGVMAMRGLLNVDEERNLTRPIFEEAYRQDGVKKT